MPSNKQKRVNNEPEAELYVEKKIKLDASETNRSVSESDHSESGENESSINSNILQFLTNTYFNHATRPKNPNIKCDHVKHLVREFGPPNVFLNCDTISNSSAVRYLQRWMGRDCSEDPRSKDDVD